MTIDQIRARLAAISAQLEGISAGAEGFTSEQITQIEDLNTEFESLTAQMSALEKVEAMKAKSETPAPRKTQAAAPSPRIEVGASATDRFGGFKNSGEFLMAVKSAAGGRMHEKLQNAVAYEKNGEDGGFLVPEEMSSTIIKKLASSESLLSATRQMRIGGNSLGFPVDESQPWNSGVQAYWTGEGATITQSKPQFKRADLRLQKLAALVPATDELLEDAMALESYINLAAPEAIMHKINGAILTGDGVGKPQGLLTSPFTVEVAKESGQAADTIVAKNIIKMYSRMIPAARANAKWYINAGAEEQLIGLKDDNGNFIYFGPGAINAMPYGTLLGRPVVPMMSALPALGDAGDILFGNLDYYWTIVKAGGVKSSTSIHLYFDRDITAFKFTMRVDGKVPFSAPVTTEFGSHQMSAFVKLADRA